jgi:DNA-binding CsgD family transcriptional regulator
VSSFTALGLSETDWDAYQVWLRHPSWSLQQVAARMRTSVDVVSACRDHLLTQGLLVVDPADGARLLPVGPDDVTERMLAEIQLQAERRRAGVLKAQSELSALLSFHLAERVEAPTLEVERVPSPAATALRLDELARAASREILVVHQGKPPCCESTGTCRVVRADRAVEVKALYGREEAAERLDELSGDGLDVRATSRLLSWSVVVDRTVGVVPSDDAVLVVRNPGIVAALVCAFDHHWSTAVGLGEDAAAAEVTERDLLLLRLLALGIKDEAIARQLGVSVRSVRRQASSLFAHLGVTSRFQAGVQAVRRGWL